MLLHPDVTHGRSVTFDVFLGSHVDSMVPVLMAVQLPERASHQRHFDAVRDALRGGAFCHVGQPVISATLLPRLAAMRSGDGMTVSAFMVARTTLIGLREP